LLFTTTVEAQITETVQKLLPATVAVELKTESATANADEQSKYKALSPVKRNAQPIEKQFTQQQEQTARRQYRVALEAFKQTAATQEQLKVQTQLYQQKRTAKQKYGEAAQAYLQLQATGQLREAKSQGTLKKQDAQQERKAAPDFYVQLRTIEKLKSDIQAAQESHQKQVDATIKLTQQQLKVAAQLTEQLAKQQSQAAAMKVDAVSYATGTIVSADGLIITMLGSDGGKFTVTLDGGKQLPAKLVAVDRRSGLQLLKIDAQDLPHVKLVVGDVLLGGQVATVMCTDVSDRAAATGIITAKGRSVSGLTVECLQTDLQIGPMSAGAPLANLRGELIGIFVAKKDDVAGLSFAVPTKYVLELLESDTRDEAIVLERGFLGVQLDDGKKAGYILKVIEDSPAANAGFKKGDAIIKIDGESTSTSVGVIRAVGRHKAGDKITITSERDGETRQFIVTLEALPKLTSKTTATFDSANQAIRVWRPSQIVVAGEKGELKLWTPKVGEGGNPNELKLTYPSQAELKLSADRYKKLIQDYYRAYEAQSRWTSYDQFGARYGQPAVRVERSDVQKQLGALTEQVKSLQDAVKKLTEELKDVGTKIGR